MTRIRTIKTLVAGLILISFFGTWLAMEWTGREPDTIILLGAVAIGFGAGYFLWDDAMSEGIDAVEDLQNGSNTDGDQDEDDVEN